MYCLFIYFFFSSRRRHTRYIGDWSSDVCSSDLHLRDYNYPTLWSISIHEVYPGHFLHYQHLRRVESKARKSILFAPASFIEGWARSEERRVGKECRSRCTAGHCKEIGARTSVRL